MNEDTKETKSSSENRFQAQILKVKQNENKSSQDKENMNKRKIGSIQGKESKEIPIPLENNFNIYSRGTIINAKKHRSATRPKKEIQPLTEEEEFKHICPCCGLPEKVIGKLEYFETMDNPDEFSNCGQGVVLYYDYIKFVIIIALIASVGMTCFNIYFSYSYYDEMTKVCNNYYHNEYQNLVDKSNYYKECQFYMTDSDPEIDGDNIKHIESFFFKFSSVNIKDYRNLYKKLYQNNNKDFESTIVNISMVNFIILIVLFVFNLIYIYFLFNKSNAADFLVFTVSDYAIFLTNLYDLYNKFKENLETIKEKEKIFKEKNKQINIEYYLDKIGFKPDDDMNEIKMFENFLKEKVFKEKTGIDSLLDYGVNRIDFCYKSGEIIDLKQKLNEANVKINKIDFDPNIIKENEKLKLKGDERNYYSYILPFCPFTYFPKKEIFKDINNERKNIEDKMNTLIKDSKEKISEYFGGAAFITFNTIKQQEEYLSKLPNNFFDYVLSFIQNMKYLFFPCCVNKNSTSYYKRNIRFESAPEPADIIFENIETKQIVRIIKTAIVYFISVILCGVSFAAIYGLNLLQMSVDENQKNQTTHVVLLYVISFAITGVTSGMDILLEIVLEKLTKWERQTTWTNYYLSFSLKLTLFSFFNSAILPTFCEFFINNSDGYEILISNMLMKFLVNAIVTPAMWTLNVGYYIKKIKIYYLTSKEDIDISQKDLNELYEYPPMNVSAKYSYIAKTILMSFFYIPIFPLGIAISLLGFILGYWLEKYNFANMYKIPEMLNRQITEFYSNYFVLAFFVYGIGDYVFLNDCYENKAWSLVNIIFFGILIIFPYHQMLTFDFLKFEESQIHEKDYDEKYTDFITDYERANPMTEREGKMRYLEAKKAKGEIKEDEYNKEKNEIQNETLINSFSYVGGGQGPPIFRNPWQEGGFRQDFFKHIREGFSRGLNFGSNKFQILNFKEGYTSNTSNNNINNNLGPIYEEGYQPQNHFPPIQEEGGYTSNMDQAPYGGFSNEGYNNGGYNSEMANNFNIMTNENNFLSNANFYEY